MMATNEQPTCEQRIDSHMRSRLEDFDDLFAVIDDPQSNRAQAVLEHGDWGLDSDSVYVDESAQERLYEYPLGVSRYEVIRVDLSTGGPADWFEAHYSADQGIFRIDYVFQDWFDVARRTLEGDEFDTAARFIADAAGIEV